MSKVVFEGSWKEEHQELLARGWEKVPGGLPEMYFPGMMFWSHPDHPQLLSTVQALKEE